MQFPAASSWSPSLTNHQLNYVWKLVIKAKLYNWIIRLCFRIVIKAWLNELGQVKFSREDDMKVVSCRFDHFFQQKILIIFDLMMIIMMVWSFWPFFNRWFWSFVIIRCDHLCAEFEDDLITWYCNDKIISLCIYHEINIKHIFCRAENSLIPGSSIEAR